MTEFRRARQPEQKSARRKALLSAAASLFDAQGPSGAGLNAIAARAGFTKSNVYRYFESREDVLLALLLGELDRLADAIENRTESLAAGNIAALAGAITACILAQPRYCHLSSIFFSVLEQNVSVDTIVAVKRHIAARSERIVAVLRRQMPGASLEDCGWALAMTLSLIAGMWPGAHPSPSASLAMSRPEFAHMLLKPERDLTRAIEAFLTSIA